MNINFKIIKSIYILFILNSILCANQGNIMSFEGLSKNKELLFTLDLKKNTLLVGNYELNKNIDKMILLDKNKNYVKRLDFPNKLNSKFFLKNEENKKHFIKIFFKEKNTKYKVQIEKSFPFSYSEIKTNQDKPLSKLLQKEQEKLHVNKNTDSFWKKIKKIGTPLVEKRKDGKFLVTFLYRGAKYNVKLLGGIDHNRKSFKRLENSDIWYKSFILEKGVNMSYQLAPDIPTINGTMWEKRVSILATVQNDPLNKNLFQMRENFELDKSLKYSTFRIIDKKVKDYTKENSNPKGILKNLEIESKILKNKRDIIVYFPPNFDNKKKHNLLFVFDGNEYLQKVNLPLILDNLHFSKKITQTIAVFIDNPTYNSRSIELPPNKKFADFMAKELFPFVKEKFKLKHKASSTILTGSSYGGLASAYVAFEYPEIFAKVLSQSGSFWWDRKPNKSQWLTKKYKEASKKNIEFYLNAGIYETGYMPIDILQSNINFEKVLKEKGYKVFLDKVIGGHDYFSWKHNISKGLIYLLRKP